MADHDDGHGAILPSGEMIGDEVRLSDRAERCHYPTVRWRPSPVALVFFALLTQFIAGCSDRSTSGDRLVGGDELLVPADVDGFQVYLAWQYWPGSERGDGYTRDSGPTLVLRVDGAVIGVVATPIASLRAGWGSDALRPIFGLPQPGTAVAWQSGKYQVEARSLTADREQLLTLQRKVIVGRAGVLTTDQDVIGELPANWQRPGRGVIAAYDAKRGDGQGGAVTVFTATPPAQRAFLALLHQDPDTTVPSTGEDCCSAELFRRPVTRTVHGRRTTVGTLTPTLRAVIIEGSPGAVMLSPSSGETAFTTADLFQVASSLHAVQRSKVASALARLTD